MQFFHYWKPFDQRGPDGSYVVGAVRLNQQQYRIMSRGLKNGGAHITLEPVFIRVYHPLDSEIQRAVIELWLFDRREKNSKR